MFYQKTFKMHTINIFKSKVAFFKCYENNISIPSELDNIFELTNK